MVAAIGSEEGANEQDAQPLRRGRLRSARSHSYGSGDQLFGHCRYRAALLDGSVNVLASWRGDYTYVCNIHGGWGGISPEVCLGWYGALVKAQADSLNVIVYYNTGSYTCSNLPTYASAPAPYYLGLD